jgi:hypothetical protein
MQSSHDAAVHRPCLKLLRRCSQNRSIEHHIQAHQKESDCPIRGKGEPCICCEAFASQHVKLAAMLQRLYGIPYSPDCTGMLSFFNTLSQPDLLRNAWDCTRIKPKQVSRWNVA